MFYGNSNRNRTSVDERVIFERLWRGALCQALGNKAPARSISKRECCCHCRCLGENNYNIPANNRNQIEYPSERKAMRSVIR